YAPVEPTGREISRYAQVEQQIVEPTRQNIRRYVDEPQMVEPTRRDMRRYVPVEPSNQNCQMVDSSERNSHSHAPVEGTISKKIYNKFTLFNHIKLKLI
ncbi:unnamed protein product, partial [Brachionus calyciflorus]